MLRRTITPLALIALLAPATAVAQVTLPFEGFITDEAQMPIDTPVDIVVRLYDVENGGTPLFEETHTGVMPLGGYFYFTIGEVQALDASIFNGAVLYLGVEVGDDATELAPRFRAGFVPFAVRALSADAGGPVGPTGPTGATGPAGLDGPPGPAGPTGPQGAIGPAGGPGPAGAAGPTGAPGPAGATGAIGPQGPTGAVGAQGPQGPTGNTGNTGPQGPQGPTGNVGPTGAVGPQGPIGNTGPQGPIGNTGNTGPQGPAGAVGPAGPAGPAGPQGNVGPRGPTGNTGPQGPIGNTGNPGPQGPTGSIGPQGPAGAIGPAGPTGNTGATGNTGPQGATGATGPAGVPCASCVNDASIADRQVRAAARCEHFNGNPGQFGYLFISNNQSAYRCRVPRPSDLVTTGPVTIEVTYRNPTTINHTATLNLSVVPLSLNTTVPNGTNASSARAITPNVSLWSTTRTAAAVFGGTTGQASVIQLTVPSAGRGVEVLDIAVLYTAAR
ncbi:MAG: hypothetical protein RIT81_24400 [Deltaproteobacteria bacterium]